MSNPFTTLQVFLNYATGHVVQWQLDPVFKEAEPYSFTLECSETSTFEPLLFSKKVGNTFFAVDDNNLKQSWHKSYFYRVKLTTQENQYTSRTLNFDTDSVDRHKYLLAAEMLRKEFLEARYVGREGCLLKRKGYGVVSTQTVDPVSGVALTDNPVDFGTGLLDGYHKPIKVIYKRLGSREDEALNPQGFGANSVMILKVRMVGFPYVDRNDILVTPEDERYNVKEVERKIFPGTNLVILQNVELTRIASTDSIYKIPIQ